MKLSSDQIHFIDTYLINSEVIYVDIRLEMLDHIALAVEQKMESENQDFYDAFKDFMLQHKKEILVNNKKPREFSWDSIKYFLLFLVKPTMLVFGVVLFLFFKGIDVNPYFSKNFTFYNLLFFMIFSTFLFQLVYFDFYLKKRFYSIEKAGTVYRIIYSVQLFFMIFFGSKNISVYTFSILSFVFFGYVLFFIKGIVKFNKHQFNYI